MDADSTQRDGSSDMPEAQFTDQERSAAAAIWLCAVAGRDAVAQQQVIDALLSPDTVVIQHATPAGGMLHLPRTKHVWGWEPFVGTLVSQGAQGGSLRQVSCTRDWWMVRRKGVGSTHMG